MDVGCVEMDGNVIVCVSMSLDSSLAVALSCLAVCIPTHLDDPREREERARLVIRMETQNAEELISTKFA